MNNTVIQIHFILKNLMKQPTLLEIATNDILQFPLNIFPNVIKRWQMTNADTKHAIIHFIIAKPNITCCIWKTPTFAYLKYIFIIFDLDYRRKAAEISPIIDRICDKISTALDFGGWRKPCLFFDL